jgi:hypothetical protein
MTIVQGDEVLINSWLMRRRFHQSTIPEEPQLFQEYISMTETFQCERAPNIPLGLEAESPGIRIGFAWP